MNHCIVWYCIVLHSSIYIVPLSSRGPTEALLVRLAIRNETSFNKYKDVERLDDKKEALLIEQLFIETLFIGPLFIESLFIEYCWLNHCLLNHCLLNHFLLNHYLLNHGLLNH